mgnify:CR=1 FL=1
MLAFYAEREKKMRESERFSLLHPALFINFAATKKCNGYVS